MFLMLTSELSLSVAFVNTCLFWVQITVLVTYLSAGYSCYSALGAGSGLHVQCDLAS